MVTHEALCHRIEWLQATFHLACGDSIIQKAAYSFGISEWEIFWPLLVGGKVVLAEPNCHGDPRYLHALTRAHSITCLFFVPSLLSVSLAMLDVDSQPQLTSVHHVFCAGEALHPATCVHFHGCSKFPFASLHNLYGPTESDMTIWTCPSAGSNMLASLIIVPAGRPTERSAVFVLDSSQCPIIDVGIEGEIAFGGIGMVCCAR